MNIHLPAILMFTRGTRFWHTAKWDNGTTITLGIHQIKVCPFPQCHGVRATTEAKRSSLSPFANLQLPCQAVPWGEDVTVSLKEELSELSDISDISD